MGPDKDALLSARILRRMRTLNITEFEAYEVRFRSDPSEVEHFINAVTTNTTYFFREPDHFDLIAAHLQQQVAAGQRRIRIWCAASSTGEEPYTLAMVLHRALQDSFVDLAILATDIDTRVLARARAGIYPRSALDKVPTEYQTFAFEPHPDGVVVRPRIRELVRFARLNLDRPPYPMSGPLDIILCRNVMIYFDTKTRGVLVREFQRLLSSSGLLVIGHSESLQGLNSKLGVVKPSVYAAPIAA